MMPEQDGIEWMPQMLREWRGVKIIAIPGGGRVDKSDYFGVTQKLGAIAASDESETDALAEMLESS